MTALIYRVSQPRWHLFCTDKDKFCGAISVHIKERRGLQMPSISGCRPVIIIIIIIIIIIASLDAFTIVRKNIKRRMPIT